MGKNKKHKETKPQSQPKKGEQGNALLRFWCEGIVKTSVEEWRASSSPYKRKVYLGLLDNMLALGAIALFFYWIEWAYCSDDSFATFLSETLNEGLSSKLEGIALLILCLYFIWRPLFLYASSHAQFIFRKERIFRYTIRFVLFCVAAIPITKLLYLSGKLNQVSYEFTSNYTSIFDVYLKRANRFLATPFIVNLLRALFIISIYFLRKFFIADKDNDKLPFSS